MTINKNTAQRLWEMRFGNRMAVKDIFGSTMRKSAYNQRGADGAWNIHHIVPKSESGTDNEVNLIIISMDAHDQIGDSYPSYSVNGEVYDVKKVKGADTYKITRRERTKQQVKNQQSRWAKKREMYEDVRYMSFDSYGYDDD